MPNLDPYQKNLAGLLLVCCTLLAAGSRGTKPKPSARDGKGRQYGPPSRGSQWAFYVVYALVMASDWLQGPYLYSLYRDEHAVPPNLVPTLFTAGFLSGTLAATVTGSLADRFGRRLACLSFCLIYAVSCILTTIPNLPSLFAGRVLGGVGTSLLFSVFESWMVADFRARHLESKGLDLGRTFGVMSTVNSVVAIGSGVVSEWVVGVAETKKAPFGVCVVVLGIAAVLIYTQWDENYGDSVPSSNSEPQEDKLNVLTSRQVLSLGLASTMFEGSMYLFVFSWGPTLEAAHRTSGSLPYGTIFAAFMASMMASSLLFTRISMTGHKMLLAGLLAVSTGIFYTLSMAPESEQVTFWLFCAFEACVGLYWPCIGVLKGRMVDDDVRARVYGILRIPLNVFVVVSLLMTGEEGEFGAVFGTCSGLLLVAALGFVFLGTRGESTQKKQKQ